uniref:Uncharacterized protein n=1 Tax=Oryza nivara TaxID=4536 RepID=A0A0E0HM45_ORYNI
MASGQVLGGRRQRERGGRRRGQGAIPGDPGRLLRALRLQQALPLRRRRLRRQRRRRRRRRSRSVGDGRFPRRDGADDEPGDACGELRGVAAAVRGHVPGRHRRRPLPVDAAAAVMAVASGGRQCTIAGGGGDFTQGREQAVLTGGDGHGLRFERPAGHFGLLFRGAMDVAGREHCRRRWRRQEEKAEAAAGEPQRVVGC